MALRIIAEALARLEHKQDIILRALRFLDSTPVAPMHFVGAHNCPLCNKPVDYQVDLGAGVVRRICDCRTGKVPSLIPLLPLTQGAAPHGNPPAGDGPESGGQARAPQDRR